MSSLSAILSGLGPLVLPALILGLYYYHRNASNYWRKRGVSGPEPLPLVGNMLGYLLNRKVRLSWSKKYGKVYGIYEGRRPTLVAADPEVLRQIAIKDFSMAPNHSVPAIASDIRKNSLIGAQDDTWRKQRTLTSGTFTSGKMRRMYKLLDVCAEDMLSVFREHLDSGKSVVNLKDLFSLFTMDAIASCCYGLKMDRYKSFNGGLKQAATRNDFVRDALKLFDFKIWRLLVYLCVHERILTYFKFTLNPYAADAFSARVQKLIAKRRDSGKHFDDYLQTLLDAKLDARATGGVLSGKVSEEEDNRLDAKESHHVGEMEAPGSHLEFSEAERSKVLKSQENTLNDHEILSNAVILLAAGLETTATLLAHCFYALSFHQTIQERLYETIKEIAHYDDKKHEYTFDYDTLISCAYLDAVISETLRCVPAALQTDRKLAEDYYLASHDIHLEKGTRILIHLGEIMHDSDYWPEPEKFKPERFMPGEREKIVPGSYCPFGLGPRHCLGMRFSLTESKLALAKLLMEFKFEPAPGLSFPPIFKVNVGLNSIKRPEVRVVRRRRQQQAHASTCE